MSELKRKTIYEIGLNYLGEKEKPNNSGFLNNEFTIKMQSVGWYKYAPWCMYFAKYCMIQYVSYLEYDKIIKNSIIELLSHKLNGSVVSSWDNINKVNNPLFKKYFFLHDDLMPNSIAFFRLGKSSSGHAVVVGSRIDFNSCKTIEGNSNNNGGREGICVAEHVRHSFEPFKAEGLNFIGCLQVL